VGLHDHDCFSPDGFEGRKPANGIDWIRLRITGGSNMGRPSLLAIVYLVIGVLVAASKNYFADIDGVQGLISAALAIALWPLVLLGVDLELGKGGRERGLLLPGAARAWSMRPGGRR
jgi:hypothetical protein